MIKSQPQSRWALQSSYTRIATSISFAAALMAAFYCVVSYGPTLVNANSLLLSFFENDDQARRATANFVIWFSLGMQVVLAVVCAHIGKSLTGKEKLDHNVPFLLLALYVVVTFVATLVFAVAMYSPAELSKIEAPNASMFATQIVMVVVYLVALLVPLFGTAAASKDNPMFALAMAKILMLVCAAVWVPSKVTLTLLVGSYILDFLLHEVGEKIRKTTA